MKPFKLIGWCILAVGFFPPLVDAADQPWIKVTSPYFTILSTATKTETANWAVELEDFFTELSELMPASADGRPPLTILMFANDAAMQPFKPKIAGYPAPSAAYFWLNRNYALIALSPQTDVSGTRRLIFHEAAHWLTGERTARYPIWFNEGLAEVVSSFAVTKGVRTMGEPIAAHIVKLKNEGLMPTEQLLALDRHSPLYEEGHRENRFYAQAWALAHLLFFEKDGSARPHINEYLGAAARGEAPGEAFTRIFHLDYAQVDRQLTAYLAAGKYGASRRTLDRPSLERSLAWGPAAKWETDVVFGLVHLASGRLEEAGTALRSARGQRPNEPWSNLYLGLVEHDRRDLAAALVCFDRTIAADGESSLAYFWRAQCRLEMNRRADGTYAGSDPRELRRAADDLVQVIRLSPTEVPAYESFAGLFPVLNPLTADDRNVLQVGAERWPGNARLVIRVAMFDYQQGRRPEAHARLAALSEYRETVPADLLIYARNQLRAWDSAERLEELNKLVADKNYSRLHERLDELLQDPLMPPEEKLQWEAHRKQLAVMESIEKAEKLLGEGQREEAATLLQEVLAMKAASLESRLKAQAMLKRIEDGSSPASSP